MTPSFEAILFDYDGVLVDSEPVHYACWYDLLRTVGIELTWEAYHTRFSGISHLGLIVSDRERIGSYGLRRRKD